jgi:hypothetical protein
MIRHVLDLSLEFGSAIRLIMTRYPWGFFHPQLLNASSQHQIIGSKDWVRQI